MISFGSKGETALYVVRKKIQSMCSKAEQHVGKKTARCIQQVVA